MAAGGHGDRIALGSVASGVSFAQLAERAAAGGQVIRERGARHLLYLGRNGVALPQAMFAAVAAGTPSRRSNYRLSSERVVALAERFESPLVLVDPDYADVPIPPGLVWDLDEFVAASASRVGPPLDFLADDDAPAVMLFTSGTTAEPKIISLSHDNLTSYVIETVEFGSASESECALTSTPPYHIAAIASILSNLYAGRRVVYLPDFDAERWLSLVREESVTSAMIVPTMMSRIVDQLDGQPAVAPSLRLLSYGGSRSVPSVVEAAMTAFPSTDFCNAYG